MPFHAAAELLRALSGAGSGSREAARAHVRDAVCRRRRRRPVAASKTCSGIARPRGAAPQIDPDARRRRLPPWSTPPRWRDPAPAVYVIEDAHWIDGVSESMLADFLRVVPQTHSLVLITYRPEYRGCTGPCATVPDDRACAAERFGNARHLISELLGHGSVGLRAGRPDRRTRRGQPVLRRGDRSRPARTRRPDRRPWCISVVLPESADVNVPAPCRRRSPRASTGSTRGQAHTECRGGHRFALRRGSMLRTLQVGPAVDDSLRSRTHRSGRVHAGARNTRSAIR